MAVNFAFNWRPQMHFNPIRMLVKPEVDNARVNRATGKGLNLRVEWMVKSAIADHPRNEPTQPRDVASVQRIVIPRPTISLSTS